MADDSVLRERAESAEARLTTVLDQYRPAIERVRQFKANFGVKEHSDGTIDIDFDKFVANLGIEQALELRAMIDSAYRISGVPGEKPRVRLQA